MTYQTARPRAYMFPLDHGKTTDAVEVRHSVEALARRVAKKRIALALETDRNYRRHFLRTDPLDKEAQALILESIITEHLPHVRSLLRTAQSVARNGISVFPIDYQPTNPQPLNNRIERAKERLVSIGNFSELVEQMAHILALYNTADGPRETMMARSIRRLSADGYTAIFAAVGYYHVLPLSESLSLQFDIRFAKRISPDEDLVYSARKAVTRKRQTPEQTLAVALAAMSVILEDVTKSRLRRWPTEAERTRLASVDSLDQAREIFEELPRIRSKRDLDDVLRIA